MLPAFPPPSTGVKKTWSSGQLGPIRSRLRTLSARSWQRRWQCFQGGCKRRRAPVQLASGKPCGGRADFPASRRILTLAMTDFPKNEIHDALLQLERAGCHDFDDHLWGNEPDTFACLVRRRAGFATGRVFI
jgi:hypothetical protein